MLNISASRRMPALLTRASSAPKRATTFSTISPQLQEVIYRALEREPKNRYASAHDFAFDLANLDRIEVVHRPELRTWQKRPMPRWKRVVLLLASAALPAVIFGLLLYFSWR